MSAARSRLNQIGKLAVDHQVVIASISYILVVLGLWGVYGFSNGFGYETGLITTSDESNGLGGFFYVDPLRKFTSFFYHLSYVLGALFGVNGSFMPYQFVYATLWVGRGLLTYLIVRELMPGRPSLALLAGLLATLHTGDGSLNWIGQLNQFGFVFWTLLSFLLFLNAMKAPTDLQAAVWAGGASLGGYLSLWSYESPLPVLAAFPLSVAIVMWSFDWRRLGLISTIHSVPIVWFTLLNVQRYIENAGSGTYQASVARTDFTFSGILGDLGLHMKNAFAFWTWPHVGLNRAPFEEYVIGFIPVLLGIALIVSVALFAERRSLRPFARDSRLGRFAIVAIGLIVASYLVPLMLADNRNLWRTEYLPTFASGALAATGFYVGMGLLPSFRLRAVACGTLVSVIGFYAVQCGVNSGRYQSSHWQPVRELIASILYHAPTVADGTLVVVRGMPYGEGYFGHNMWFDLGLRIAYPRTRVAGIYYLDDGKSAPGLNISLAGGKPQVLPHGFPTLFHVEQKPPIRHVLVFDVAPGTNQAALVARGPITMADWKLSSEAYKPCDAVKYEINSIGIRRFGPIRGVGQSVCIKPRSE